MITFLLAQALLFANLGDFKLQNGQVLKNCKIGYRTYGTLNADKSNVVLWPSWFNGKSGDLAEFIGPSGLVDSSKYYVIAVDALGNSVSTSPSNTPGLNSNKFPNITIADMVASQYLLLTRHLKLNHIHTVMGVSMGAMQAFEWAEEYPDFMDKAIPIVGTPRMSAKDMELWAQSFKLPGGNNNKPADPDAPPKSKTDRWLGIIKTGVDNYSKYRNPIDVLKQFEAMRSHDIARNHQGNMEVAAKRIKAQMLIVVATQDKAVSPETPLQFAKLVPNATLLTSDSTCGHFAFRCERDTMGPKLREFMDSGRIRDNGSSIRTKPLQPATSGPF